MLIRIGGTYVVRFVIVMESPNGGSAQKRVA